jgi:outer membrane lipoprotein carrier protein
VSIPTRSNCGNTYRAWLLGGFLLLAAAWPPASAQTVDLSRTLKGIEDRYNRTQTLEVAFGQSYTARGRRWPTESGTLFLRKPGKMRWQYSQPAGKLFISDGKYIYSYIPEEKRAEKVSMKEVADMRAPLAFLLGRLNFSEDFREFRASPQGQDALITAIPKSDKLPFTEVTFLAAPDFTLRRVTVKGADNSLNEYVLTGEKRNPPVAESMFRFVAPAGVEVVDLSE